jgi:hypothetical protein
MTAAPSCPSSLFDRRVLAVGSALVIAAAGTLIAGLQLRVKVTAPAVVVTTVSGLACLVYGFLLMVLTFCAVPSAY